MRKLVPGGSEHSFGIHVAKMAGMPRKVLERAEGILKQLEGERKKGSEKNVLSNGEGKNGALEIVEKKQLSETKNHSLAGNDYQLSFFQLNDPVLEQIKEQIEKTDINTLTPVEALLKLNEIKKLIGG